MSVPTPYPTITALPVPVVEMSSQGDPWAPLIVIVVVAALGVVAVGRNVFALLVGGALLVAFDAVRLNPSGVALLGAFLWLIAFWLSGGFTRSFWIEDEIEVSR